MKLILSIFCVSLCILVLGAYTIRLVTYSPIAKLSPKTNPTPEELLQIKSLIIEFEKNIQERNVPELMALFTPPKTKEDKASYSNLMGKDPDIGNVRLFNNVTSNFIVTSWEFALTDWSKKEIIYKHDYSFDTVVKETRKSWCNSKPYAGTYSFENTNYFILEVVIYNGKYMVDKYYVHTPVKDPNIPKYQGLNF